MTGLFIWKPFCKRKIKMLRSQSSNFQPISCFQEISAPQTTIIQLIPELSSSCLRFMTKWNARSQFRCQIKIAWKCLRQSFVICQRKRKSRKVWEELAILQMEHRKSRVRKFVSLLYFYVIKSITERWKCQRSCILYWKSKINCWCFNLLNLR